MGSDVNLHLGVVRKPYPDRIGVTTEDVAAILEAKYHIMAIFLELNADKIAGYVEDSLKDSLEAQVTGSPKPSLGDLEEKIENRFRQFLSKGDMEKLGYPGIPTQAALRGRSFGFTGPRSKRRKSFIDSGLYMSSFKATVE